MSDLLKVENPIGFLNAVSLIIIFWSITALVIVRSFYVIDPMLTAYIGDSFGIINSLFSALAFAALFYTILLQKKELSATREEFIEQNETLRIQRFENTFFNLMGMHEETIHNLVYKDKTHEFIGRDYLKQYYRLLEKRLISVTDYQEVHFELYFSSIYQNFESIQVYFRSLLNILKYIDGSSLQEKDKPFYFSIISSRLANYEHSILFYHTFFSRDFKESENIELRRLLICNGFISSFSNKMIKDIRHLKYKAQMISEIVRQNPSEPGF